MFNYRKHGTNEPTVTMAPFQTKAGSFVQNHGRRVKATIHSTGSSSSGFRLRQSAPMLSRPRMARNRKRYGCSWRLAIGRSSPAESACRSTAPIPMSNATTSKISDHMTSGYRKIGGLLVCILSFWCVCVCSRVAWQVTSCGLASVSSSVLFCGGYKVSFSGPWLM